MHDEWGYNHFMRLAACLLFALATSASAVAAAEQCRFIEARPEREACYQRQDVARAARQQADAARQAQQKPYEPMAQEDAQLAKSLRSICRGC
jgi:Skp family chaperone for outer membrane proteins